MKAWKTPVIQMLTATELAAHIQAAALSGCYDMYFR